MEQKTGLVHIYCGDGKGKTTAALGLAVRAAGRGKRILIARFLKTDDSGEVPVLGGIPGIRLIPCKRSFGFFSRMTETEKKEAGEYYNRLFHKAWREGVEEKFDMILLDEIMAACRYGLVPEAELLKCLREKPDRREVVMTGRDPSEALLNAADYVSEVCKRKHPYDRGVTAREGIEY